MSSKLVIAISPIVSRGLISKGKQLSKLIQSASNSYGVVYLFSENYSETKEMILLL